MPILSNNQLLNDGTFNNKKDCSTSSQETGQDSSQKVNNSWYKLDTFFGKVISWLDLQILQENRKHFHLKNSDSKFERFLWEKVYKPETSCSDYLNYSNKNPIKLFQDSEINPAIVRKKASKIIHVINYINPKKIKNKDFKKRISLTLQSIRQSSRSRTEIIAFSSSPENFKTASKNIVLNRHGSTEFKNCKDVAFLIDMLDEACKHCEDNDYIVYSNLDCPIVKNFYQNILNQNEDIIQYFVREVHLGNKRLAKVLKSDFIVKLTGVDGFAIKKGVYLCLRKYLPDFVIGEPHWDTVYWGIFQKFHYAQDNTKDLYHPIHEKQWETINLSQAGKHNEKLYRDAYEYGIIDESVIRLRKQNALFIINDCGLVKCKPKITSILKKYPDLETVLIDLVYKDSELQSNLNESVLYFPIKGNEKTINQDQRKALMNIACNLFLDRSHFFFLNITDEKVFFAISKEEFIEQGKFNLGINNNDIENILYINDEGLISEK